MKCYTVTQFTVKTLSKNGALHFKSLHIQCYNGWFTFKADGNSPKQHSQCAFTLLQCESGLHNDVFENFCAPLQTETSIVI